MKYWRGYLVAGIIGLFSQLLIGFASSHIMLMDMVYPYIARMLQGFLSGWSSQVEYLLWDLLLGTGMVVILGTAVLMIVLRWNPIQWFGWVLAGVSLVFFLNTAIYGLSTYSSPLSEDIRLHVSEYTLSELQSAATYYRDQANRLADNVSRDEKGNVVADLPTVAQQGVEAYEHLIYKKSLSVYAGAVAPVKTLEDADSYTERGITGTTVPLTGEAAVNPQVPGAIMPYAVCHEMAHRMCIPLDRDADISAYIACTASSDVEFRYSGYLMAYRSCYRAMLGLASEEAQTAARELQAGVSDSVYHDLQQCDRFLQNSEEDFLSSITAVYLDQLPQEDEEDAIVDPAESATVCDLLVSWHLQEIVLPMQEAQNVRFDPFDETQVDLTGIVNAKTTEPTTGE